MSDNRVNQSITILPSTKRALKLLSKTKNNSVSRLVENALLPVFHSEPGFVELCHDHGIMIPPPPSTPGAS
jgi:hypothetical protein